MQHEVIAQGGEGGSSLHTALLPGSKGSEAEAGDSRPCLEVRREAFYL